MFSLIFILLLKLSLTFCHLSCPTPVVCDPSLESDIHLQSAHFADETQCEASCTIGHPFNPCKFFTWVPNAQAQVPNCYQMKACNEMADPITGAKSGAWSCDDPDIFCGPIGNIPAYDDKKTVWTCDHGVHPYGNGEKKIFQDTTCRATCPSFEHKTAGNHRSDLVVSSSCMWDSFKNSSVWGPASPATVVDSSGTEIVSAATNPTPWCGCKDLVLAGTVQEEEGKVFKCSNDDIVNGDGDTVITQDNDCVLLCDGTHVFDLYCSVGQWSVDYLTSAQDIYCYGGSHNNGSVTLSTFWPTVPSTAVETTTITTTETKTPAVDTTTPAVETTTPAVETTAPAVESTTPSVETTPPAAETTTPSVETTTSSVETTTSSVETTTPSVETTRPSLESTTPSVETTTPAVETTAPSVETTSHAAETTTHGVETTTPSVETTTPSVESTTPSLKSTTPSVEFSTSSVETTTPSVENTTPLVETTTPAIDTTKPSAESTVPAV